MVTGPAARCKHQPMASTGGQPHRWSDWSGWSAYRRIPGRRLTISLLSVASIAGPILPPGPSTTTTTTTPTPTATTTTLLTAGPTLGATWTLAFGGDTLLTRAVAETTNPFAGIRPPLVDADLAIVNLETAISTRGRAQIKEFTFRSAPSFADRLAASGIDVVSLANNHTLDFGVDALRDTIANLDRVDVAHVGAGSGIDEALAPAEFDVKGVSVGVLGASQIIPDTTWPATATRAGIASGGKHTVNAETQRLLDAVRRTRITNDVVVVIMHWGIEGNPCPSAAQKNLAALLVDAGATAVLGAHPHVLQPIVRVPAPVGDAVIAYSMGNFIWDPRSGATADTGLLRLHFVGRQLRGASFHPHRLDRDGWARAVPAAATVGRTITRRVSSRCDGVSGTSIEAVPSA